MLQHSFIWTLTDPEEDLIQNIKYVMKSKML